jgi:hypothetical protein
MSADQANPNILFIFMDNLGYGEVGQEGEKGAALARGQGVRPDHPARNRHGGHRQDHQLHRAQCCGEHAVLCLCALHPGAPPDVALC